MLNQIVHWESELPLRSAHLSGGNSLNYATLCQKARILAEHLATTLGSNCAPIVVRGHKENEMLVAFLGCALAGRAYAPVDTIVPQARLDQIVATLQSPLILTPSSIREIIAAPKRGVAPKAVSGDDPIYIMFTSGSTGEPKGVIVTHDCLKDFVDWMLAEQSVVAGKEVFLNQAPFSFDLSVMDLYMSLVSGGTLVSLCRDEIANLSQLFVSLPNSQCSIWVSTPSFAQLCTQEPGFSQSMLPKLKTFLFCGETLAPSLASALAKRFPKADVWNTYGPTEATVATSSVLITPDILARYKELPVGKSKPRSLLLVLDEKRNPVIGESLGEITIVGPNVAHGYFARPDITARSFFDYHGQRAYATGDRGFYRDDLLFCAGRSDFQLKLHGYRIELGDIETHLRALPGVRDALVIPKMSEGQAQFLAGFIVSDEATELREFERAAKIKKGLAERVPSYMVPQRIFFVSAFPMTANGKADRRALAERLE